MSFVWVYFICFGKIRYENTFFVSMNQYVIGGLEKVGQTLKNKNTVSFQHLRRPFLNPAKNNFLNVWSNNE